MNRKEVYNKIKDLDGWLTINEAWLLYNLAKKTKRKGRIVEIGSWKGRSTICLAQGLKDKKIEEKVYAIDPHIGSSEHQGMGKINTFAEFKKNIEGAGIIDKIEPIIKTSHEASKEFNDPIEFIFIDGAHEYEYVKEDFNDWFPKIVNGGVVAFHDTIVWPGPKEVVKDNIFKSKHFKNVGFIDSIVYGTKTEKNSLIDRIKSRYILFLKNSFEFLRGIKFLKPFKKIGKKIMRILQLYQE